LPKYTRETIAEVLATTDIVEVVGQYLELKPSSGGRFLACCPFHNEKTPSFTVSRDRQSYYCFGCQKGGDAISFVREQDGLSFSETVQKLADRAGIRLPTMTAEEDARDGLRTRLIGIGTFAARYFRETLEDPGKGGLGRKYLETRNLKDETIKRFGIGYAPEAWNNLMDAAHKARFKDTELEAAGLVKRGERGSYFDFFRNRLMFPIRDVAGNVVAFGGRDLSGKSPAKYMNTPENSLYKKGRVLYGLHEARDALRSEKRAILVEGYFDALRLIDSGVGNVVAPCGTALTPDQAKLIRRYVPEAVVVFDGDTAGIRAALRSVAILTAAGLTVRALVLPGGQDPDDYVLAEGIDAFRGRVEDAPDFVTFYVRMNAERADTIEGRTDLARELFTILLSLDDELRRDEYLKRVAKELHLNEWRVRSEFAKQGRKGGQRDTQARGEGESNTAAKISHDEIVFVAALLSSEALCAKAKEGFAEMPMPAPPLGPVLHEIFSGVGPDTAQRLDDAACQLYTAASATEAPVGEMAESSVEKRLLRLRREALEAQVTEVMRAIREAEGSKDNARMMELLTEKVRIERSIQQVGAA
jgi:DNA primase